MFRKWVVYFMAMAIAFCLTISPAFAEEEENTDPGGTVQEMSFTPGNPEMYQVDYHTCGEELGDGTFQYMIPQKFVAGDRFDVKILTKAGATIEKAYIFDGDRFVSEADPNDTLASGFFYIWDPNYFDEDMYFVGFACIQDSASCTYPMIITRVSSIQYIPKDPIVYEEGTGLNPATWQYMPKGLNRPGDRFIVTEEDGTVYEYVCRTVGGENGNQFICDATGRNLNMNVNIAPFKTGSDQDQVPWQAGSYEDNPGNYYWLYYSDCKCKVPVTVTENPVESISCKLTKNFEVIENAGGWREEPSGAYIYNNPGWHNGDQVTIHYKSGQSTTYTYGRNEGVDWMEENSYNCFYDLSALNYWAPNTITLVSTQTPEDPWLVGKDNTMTVAFAGRICTVPVDIISDNIKSFTYVPAHRFVYVENHGGMFIKDLDSEEHQSDEFFQYTAGKYVKEGDRLIVEYYDSRGTITYAARGEGIGKYVFVNEKNSKDIIDPAKAGNSIDFDPQAGAGYDDRWLPDHENSLKVSFRGLTCTLPVSIIPETEQFRAALDAVNTMHEAGEPQDITEQDAKAVLAAWEACEKLTDDERYAITHLEGYPVEDYMDTCVVSGHNWGTPVYQLSSDGTAVTAERTCGRDTSHTEKETVKAELIDKKEATCTEAGKRSYMTGGFANEAFSQQTIVRTIPALGHNWNAVIYKWSADNKTVTATRRCSRNTAHVQTETVRTAAKVTKAATYTAKGQTTYTASFKNKAFKVQKKTVTNISVLPKVAQPMTVAAAVKTVEIKKVKKKARTVAPITVKNAQGKVTYKLVSGSAKSKKALRINKTTGKVTVKKGTKKGTYKLRVSVTAAGTVKYKPGTKTLTVTVKVR